MWASPIHTARKHTGTVLSYSPAGNAQPKRNRQEGGGPRQKNGMRKAVRSRSECGMLNPGLLRRPGPRGELAHHCLSSSEVRGKSIGSHVPALNFRGEDNGGTVPPKPRLYMNGQHLFQ
ncbi:hypothetical protein SKAU_G00144610 [Synaphobranchus kaupii]|uniref:Uncharacterized protein n=1 Tax=Synaphobranchus kaupii TaxID=118154 RepID=A0A9Q1J4R0_SYNKA|nr:hypothetical protein SKAU_G00144610 [Synaphobranchus kaupii]